MQTFHIQTLGCKVNHYESDQMASLLRSLGLTPADARQADLRIVHTCSVTTAAASQSRQAARRLVRLPLYGEQIHETAPIDSDPTQCRQARVIVTGCWASSNGAEATAMPGVDAVLSHQHNIAAELPRLLELWQTQECIPGPSVAPVSAPIKPAINANNPAQQIGNTTETGTPAPAGCITCTIEAKPAETVNHAVGEIDGQDRGIAGVKRTPSLSLSPVLGGEGRVRGGTSSAAEFRQSITLGPLYLPKTGSPQPSPPSTREREQDSISHAPTAPPLLATCPSGQSVPSGTTALPLLDERQPNRQRAFLKIQDGCDAHCTYCIIPKLRPTLWSKPTESAVAEARALVAAGHVEIILTGIFLGAYGQPTALRRRQTRSTAIPLAELVDALCSSVPGLARLRLSSLEPGDLTNDLLSALRRHPQVVPHFHLPLQSGSAELLRRMNRQYTRDDFLNMLDRVCGAFDRPALTTDIVVGFPGETDAAFEETVDVVRRGGFIHVHAFPYSARPGTAAARWTKDFVRGPVVNQRIQRLSHLAAEQSLAFRQQFIGEQMEVIVERDETSAPLRHGRCPRYFPIHFPHATAKPGDAIAVRITEVINEMTIGSAHEIP